jgi:hypothetical protein
LSLKNRVGNFLLLFGAIGLIIFVASVLAPPGDMDVWSFVAGAALLAVGLRFRLDKSGPPIVAPPPRAPAGPPPRAAAKGKGPGPGGPPPGPPPKKQGPLATIFKGPANKKTAPKNAPQIAGGKVPAGKGGGKPGGGGGRR